MCVYLFVATVLECCYGAVAAVQAGSELAKAAATNNALDSVAKVGIDWVLRKVGGRLEVPMPSAPPSLVDTFRGEAQSHSAYLAYLLVTAVGCIIRL